MGAVYLAHDRQRGAVVALKTLRRVDASSIYRFKREFRSLSDVVHPNLVVLHDLFHEGELWFFTMEYVQGESFLSHVLGGESGAAAEDVPEDTERELERAGRGPGDEEDDTVGQAYGSELRLPSPVTDYGRLADVLLQVARGLIAIHGAGKLHRDLKSDNVIVTQDGRAKVLDFGIMIERGGGPHATLELGVMGTPAYMSPEQAAGKPIQETTDWYSLGVMLFEALTGHVPFDGTYLEVMQQKQAMDAPAPSDLVTGVPGFLDELCVRLLKRSPLKRPDGAAVIRALEQARPPSVRPSLSSIPPDPDAPFVGRGDELAALRRHLLETDRGGPVLSFVHGPSGIGKTTLVERFLAEQRAGKRVVSLRGRCYEREAVPFKAFDSLIDSLSRYLRRLPSIEAAETLPRDIQALAQLFPVLKRVEVVAAARRRSSLPPERKEQRRRAFIALRELFCRIADRSPLIVFIDDLHWGDVDSARLMAELVEGSEAPAMLVVATYRSGDRDSSPCLKLLYERLRANESVEVHELGLSPLDEAEGRELARRLLGSDIPVAVDAIARESGGSPHLATELARHLMLGRDSESASEDTQRGVVTYERAVMRRIGRLSQDARVVLDLVSVAGRPVPEDGLMLLSSFDLDLQSALVELRGAKLIRGVGPHAQRAVETYHDRVREAVVDAMDDATLERWHRRMATTLEASGSEDLEAIVEHLIGAKDFRRAQVYAIRAATQAAQALAFDKAARLFGIAVEHDRDAGWGRELLMQWGDSLANAGHGRQAAAVYLDAARSAPPDEVVVLRRKAGLQLLSIGEREEGLPLVQEMLAEWGLCLPETLGASLLEASALRKQLRVRGLRLDRGPSDEVDPEALRQLEQMWMVTFAVVVNELDRALPLYGHYLMRALEVGDRGHIARGLAGYHAAVDVPLSLLANEPEQGALKLAESLLADEESPEALARITMARGCDMLRSGQYKPALRELSRTEELLRTRCAGSTVEIRFTRTLMAFLYSVFSQIEALDRIEQWRCEADEHEDVLAATRLRLLSVVGLLADDRVASAQRELVRVETRLGSGLADITAFLRAMAESAVALYLGDASSCRAMADAFEPLLVSTLFAVPLVRAAALLARVRLSLLACGGQVDAQLMCRVETDLQAAEDLEVPCFIEHLKLLRASRDVLLGRRDSARRLMDEVVENGGAQPDHVFTKAAAERRLGELIGGEAGLFSVAGSDKTLSEQGIVRPELFVRLYAPISFVRR